MTQPAPAIKSIPFTLPAPVVGWPPAPGSDGFWPLLPVVEPPSAGVPPVAPGLVDRLGTGFARLDKRSRAGYLHTCPADTTWRPRMRVSWGRVTREQRAALRAWWRDWMALGLNAMSIEPDGPGNGWVKVFAAGELEETLVGTMVTEMSVECVEVW